MTYLPEIRDALAAAVNPDAGQARRPRRGWFERTLTRSAVAVTVLASLAIAAVVVISVHSAKPRHTSQSAGAVRGIPLTWLDDRLTASTRVGRADHRCSIDRTSGAPHPQTFLSTRPARSLASTLAVLRHPAPAQAAVTAAQLRRLQTGHLGVFIHAQGIYIRYARQGAVDGIHYYLVPAAHIDPNQLPARCFAEQSVAFAQLALALPAGQRRAAVDFEQARLRAAQGPQPPGVVLITRGDGGAGTSELPVTSLRQQPYGEAGSSGSDTVTQTVLLLPNDVATVTARYPEQTRPGRVAKPITVTRTVRNNLVLLIFRGAWDPPSLTYRSRTGKVLWTNRRR
jgi:hypothetical protein